MQATRLLHAASRMWLACNYTTIHPLFFFLFFFFFFFEISWNTAVGIQGFLENTCLTILARKRLNDTLDFSFFLRSFFSISSIILYLLYLLLYLSILFYIFLHSSFPWFSIIFSFFVIPFLQNKEYIFKFCCSNVGIFEEIIIKR